ncbi:MAG: tetratricopeptide repeat protein [Cyanobacteriota/Melainabacteria group bacterium]
MLPKNASIWTNLGTAQQQTDNQQARASYQKGYDLDKKGSVGNLYLMAAIDENYNKGMQALGLYQQYLKADPSGAYASLAQTRVAALSKNPSDIEKLQTSADRQGAEAAADAYNKGVEFQKEKKYDEAITQFQIAAQAQPNEPTYPYAIGYLYQAKEDIDNAVVYFKKAISLSTDKQQIAEYQKVLDAVRHLKRLRLTMTVIPNTPPKIIKEPSRHTSKRSKSTRAILMLIPSSVLPISSSVTSRKHALLICRAIAKAPKIVSIS